MSTTTIMRQCLADDAVLAVYFGDAAEADARHAGECLGCARRLAAVRADLDRISRALASPPPVRVTARWSAVPLAFAAAAMAAGFVVASTVTFRPFTTSAPSALVRASTEAAFLEDLSDVLDPPAADALTDADDDGATDEPSALDVALGTQSTCGVDEPFMGVGCNDTRVAALER